MWEADATHSPRDHRVHARMGNGVGGGREIDSETGPSDHLVLFVRSGGKRCRAGNMRMYGRRAQPRL